MNISFAPSEIKVLDILAKNGGVLRTLEIVTVFQKTGKNIPKQTVYRALSALKKKEVVTNVKGITSVNTHWIKHVRNTLDVLESKQKIIELPKKLNIVFPSLWALAPTWTHYVNILISQSDKRVPIIFINPHQWFYVAREWSEEQLISDISKNGYVLWQVITHNEKLDKEMIKQKFSFVENIQGGIVNMHQKDKEKYVNIIGDYVVTVLMSDKFTKNINHWYKSNTSINEDSIHQLQEIIKNSDKVKITIQKNVKKAESYRRHLSKFFYMPK